MTVTPEALQAAAIDLRVQANEVSATLENAVLLVTAAAIRKGDVDDQIAKAVAAERNRCADLADERNATWFDGAAAVSFGDLLRQPESGEQT